jgi:hypothetical protein
MIRRRWIVISIAVHVGIKIVSWHHPS